MKVFQTKQMEELMSRAEPLKKYAHWLEYFDPESGYKFYLNKNDQTISWEVPEEVEATEQQQM